MIIIEIACRNCGSNNIPKSAMSVYYNPEDVGIWKTVYNANKKPYICPNCGNKLEYRIL